MSVECARGYLTAGQTATRATSFGYHIQVRQVARDPFAALTRFRAACSDNRSVTSMPLVDSLLARERRSRHPTTSMALSAVGSQSPVRDADRVASWTHTVVVFAIFAALAIAGSIGRRG